MNLGAGRVVQGGSTITQQVAKNLFLSNARTFRRKVQEVLAPVRVDPRTAGVTCPAGATARQRLVISYDRGPTTWLLAGRDCQPQLAGPLLGATDVPPQFWSLLDRVAQAPRTTIGPAR